MAGEELRCSGSGVGKLEVGGGDGENLGGKRGAGRVIGCGEEVWAAVMRGEAWAEVKGEFWAAGRRGESWAEVLGEVWAAVGRGEGGACWAGC